MYQEGATSGELKVGRIVQGLKLAAGLLRRVGTVLMIGAAIGLVFIYFPLGWAELKYAVSRTPVAGRIQDIRYQVAYKKVYGTVPAESGGSGEIKEELPVWHVPDSEYSIYIPKIFALSKVIPGVDAANPAEYRAALKSGVAEARGLATAGETGTTFLFAHSVADQADFARYNAVFYLLHKVEEGDEVEVVRKGKLLKYRVDRKEILSAEDTKFLVPQTEEEILVLQTCYPPGTTWKRLLVVAKRA